MGLLRLSVLQRFPRVGLNMRNFNSELHILTRIDNKSEFLVELYGINMDMLPKTSKKQNRYYRGKLVENYTALV